jgi:hypothetical protein
VIRSKVRRSHHTRRCEQEFAHARAINPGDLYELVSVSPNDGILGAGHWYQFPNCFNCASQEALLEYFLRDRKGIALVAAIHHRKDTMTTSAAQPQTWNHSRKGPITGTIVHTTADGEWVDIELATDHELRYGSASNRGRVDEQGDTLRVRKSLLTEAASK